MADYASELERQGKTSHAKVRGIFKLHLTDGAPAMANTAAALVTAEQVTDLLRSLSEAGKERTAGKLRGYCRAPFEMARTSKLSLLVPVHFKGYGVHTIPLLPAAREALDFLLALNPGEFP